MVGGRGRGRGVGVGSVSSGGTLTDFRRFDLGVGVGGVPVVGDSPNRALMYF